MSEEADTARKAVVEYLQQCGVTFAVTGGMETVRDNDRKYFAWLAKLQKGKAAETFEYYTGSGLVTKPKNKAMAQYHTPRPVTPTAADVLHSLLSDAEAYSQPFHEWADNFGFDKDSIKARNTYDACTAIGLRLARLFDQTQREHLQQLLQDY